MDLFFRRIFPDDTAALAQIDALLAQEGLRRDAHLDYTCAAFDEEQCVMATGSCYASSLRCLAVSHAYRSQGLLNQLLAHLMQVQIARGNTHVFVYTKPDSTNYFRDLGFYEIARVEGTLVFLENRREGFSSYLRKLSDTRQEGKSAALVMHANPFTLGHRYLVERASEASDTLHLFVLSEESEDIPAAVRRSLVEAGTAHLPNVLIHDSGPYIISRATFPSYFLGDAAHAADIQARLDLTVFQKIARAMNITARYVGQEPFSTVTALYNDIMLQELTKAGIDCVVVPRLEEGGVPISASAVRRALIAGDLDTMRKLVPHATYTYFTSNEARPVLEHLRRGGNS